MTDSLPIDSLMIERWTNQWTRQLGFTSDQLFKRNEKVRQFAQMIIDRAQKKKIADVTKREQLLIETLREYEHRLSRTGFQNDIQEDFQTMKLKQKENFIEKKHQQLDIQEEKFIKELDQLTENQQKFCRILSTKEMEIIIDETLIKRIERLRDYLEILENLKTERLSTVKSYRNRFDQLSTQLNYQIDSSSVAKDLINENYESCLTTDALQYIESLLDELKLKSEEQEKYIEKLIGTVEKLYVKLSRNDSSPIKRSAAYILRENNRETVNQLEEEIKDLQAKRMATSETYCETMRKKIEELYELCHIGNSERQPVDFNQISPETLDDCDREFDRVDEMYRVRKPILDLYEQWKILSEQYAEFQKKSTSAARFHERGYSAVKEQAERKRFAVALPKAERTCFTALEQWEKDHPNEQFLINDVPIRQLIEPSNNATTNITTTAMTKTISASSIGTTVVPQRPLAKTNNRKKSLRNVVKTKVEQNNGKTHHEETDEDTFEFTQLENIKHFNGLPRVITSTPKTGKNNQSHTVVDTGRNKTNDPIQKRRPSKRMIPTRR